MKSTPNSNDWQQFKWKKLQMETQLNHYDSSLVVEKTPISSSPSVSPPVRLKIVVPNPECLGWKYKLDGTDGWNRSGYTRTPLTLIDTTYRLNINLKFSKNFAMGTCGACELSNFVGHFPTNGPHIAQGFVTAVLPLLDITYYGIASTTQMKSTGTPLSILREIGMKEVFKSPNRLHGPNDLHLMVLDPKELNEEGIQKYCYREKGSDIWLPLWLKDLSNEGKNKHFAEWERVNKALDAKRIQELKDMQLNARLKPVKDFASVFHYYCAHKQNSPGSLDRYSPLSAEVIQAIDALMAKYNIKVPT
jgi:hypothetical protein